MMDRMDEKFHIDRKRKHFPLSIKPSEYFKRGNIYVTCETDEKILDAVVRELGEDQSCTRRTFPTNVKPANSPSTSPSSRTAGIYPSGQARILSANAKRFFALQWNNRRHGDTEPIGVASPQAESHECFRPDVFRKGRAMPSPQGSGKQS